MKKPSLSLIITDICVKIAFLLVIAACFAAPWLIRVYDDANIQRGSVYLPLLITLYASVVPSLAILSSLYLLLKNIKRGVVFIARNTRYLRIIGYCCFALSLIFFGFGFYRPLSFAITLAAAFMGLILRVLKNVFAEAVALREENDYTI